MALLPPAYLNSVVSIRIESKDDKGQLQFRTFATGFLVGKESGQSDERGKFYRLFLVTNRHVFHDKKEISLRFNTKDKKSHHFKVSLLNEKNMPVWLSHKNEKVDLAVVPINVSAMNNAKIEYYFFKETDSFFAKDFKEKNVSTGDGLFVLGFPMGISGKEKNFVIVRKGIIARFDEEVLEEYFYYIDASAYPGNSGGPVIVKPEMVSIHGTGSNNSAKLIGVISSGETYSDVAISQQTGEAKVIFTEQTGLVRVVPIELVYEIIDSIRITEEAKVEDTSSEVKE